MLDESGPRPLVEQSAGRGPWFRVGIGAAIAGQTMLLSLAVNLSPPDGLVRWIFHFALMASSVSVLAVLGGPLFAAAWEAVRSRRLTIELLFLAGIGGALGASLHSTITGIGAVYYEVVAVLLVACPCAMGLATPVALWTALARLAERGLAPRHADVVTRLAEATHVVFDKTGTLSEEALPLIDMAVAAGPLTRADLNDVLRKSAGRAPHPVSRAFARLEPGGASVAIKAIKSVPAQGIEAWVALREEQEMHLRVGQREFAGDSSAEAALLAQLRQQPGDHLIHVSVDGRLAALCAVRERLRSSANDTVARLEQLGIKTSVFTGDRSERAVALGLAAGEGGTTPEEKVRRVTELRAAGETVVFVGDGVNDAAALRAANLGVALPDGAGLVMANADGLLYGGDLTVLP